MTKTKIGLGLASLGRPEYINIRPHQNIDKSAEAFRSKTKSVLDEAYKNGVRYFDTAPSYGRGEEFLLDWHRSRGYKDVVLGTKWGYTYKANWELGYNGPHEVKEHSLSKLREQWKYSKQLLSALKIYQIHSATFDSGVLENKEVQRELMSLKKDYGLIIGLTSSGKAQTEILEAAMRIEVDGEELFDSFQVTFNLLEQSTLSVLKKAKDKGKLLIIKEGMANGRVFPNKHFEHYQDRYQELIAMSKKFQVGIDALALRFCMDLVEPDYVLSGAGNIEQLRENLKAHTFELKGDDLHQLQSMAVDVSDYWEERSQLEWN
ncbi:aldo/keto reductase [Echinicola marina]|uniref:aldo/keto reductase n=1 Tax=Echinicola marina TaxID=2859768 RepID=UPI001CF6CE80|nr:aldo/keto reductase [Echinicola marina]UCS91632.1 aldo/keto reductase [Echinicola marina]